MSVFVCRQVVTLFSVMAIELDAAEFCWELGKKRESFAHQETIFGRRGQAFHASLIFFKIPNKCFLFSTDEILKRPMR